MSLFNLMDIFEAFHCLVVACDASAFSVSGGGVGSLPVWEACVFAAGVAVESFEASADGLAAGAAVSEEGAGVVESSSAVF